jgi:membrane protease YdiL (CAAX protease family)
MDEEFTREPSPLPLEPDSASVIPDVSKETDASVAPPAKRGWALPAWIVIILLTFLFALGQTVRKETSAGQAAEGRIGLILVELQGRWFVGLAQFPVLQDPAKSLYDQARMLNTGPILQRLCFITLAGELSDPQKALNELVDLDKKTAKYKIPFTEQEVQIERILRQLYRERMERGKQARVQPADRAFLIEHLGWFGELAVSSAGGSPLERQQVLDAAQRTALAFGAVIVFIVFFGLVGLAGLTVMLILLFLRLLRGGLHCGSLHGGIYAETFAIWMLLFIGLSVSVEFLPQVIPPLSALGIAMLLSLAALVWPVVRGIPWRQVRAEIGWTAGRRPLLEPLTGLGCYGMGLPLLAVGFGVMLILLALQRLASNQGPGSENFGPTGGAAHPIILAMATGDWWMRLQIFLVVAVCAPIVEETMFRGVLYRNLREATHRTRAIWSVLFSATVVSFIFAVIHPQGLIAVPPLMALSYTFCLTREWRGTLIPSMVAHGTNNGLLMLFLMVALGD